MQHEKIIIIGSGPAGHTAAIYAARANLKPLLFEGRMAGGIPAGGQLTTTTDVENFPGFPGGIPGPMLMERMREQSVKSGTRIITKTVKSVDLSSRPFKVTVDNESYSTDALVIATGATAKKLNISGLDTFWMKGISGCAVCDGALPIFRNKPLVVVGGGDVAMEEALHLAKFGSEVTIVIRRGIPDLRASKAMQDKVFASEKIKILEYTEVLEAKGTKLLESITLTNNRSGEKGDIPCNGLFFAIGHTPNTSFLGAQIETDEAGYIITKPGTTQTSVDGVFAAGDVQDRVFRQAITSAGTGCMAALEAEKWLLNNA